ncbi:putative c6 transcription factor protein [Phaeoacremonium minimum UCRPA7]|uniref:Putative c6 transcription factor protein n=1 Tax=Phaeoacremonium minimum (strain UCR-PA7) TaxID=1286976 RepID=R8B8W9_PHAM7|nr:putative c6 transcription factor protein [Phaeoacremonium minimum UCRPA7]EON95746.1 putative c6 transcription factor protein [Phaeoacremonium minimum UCRPA7]
MATKVKPVNGCWTCRLRRKKCDEARPVCGECRTLEVTCHFRDSKPEWMDGGDRQNAMAERLKAEVKRSATRRRSKRHIEALARGMEDDGFSFMDAAEAASMETPAPPTTTVQQKDESVVALMTPSETSMSMTPSSLGPESVDTGVFVDSPFDNSTFSHTDASGMLDPVLNATFDVPVRAATTTDHRPTNPAALQTPDPTLIKEEDQFLVMTYLDYVMPFLFPLYKPSVVDGGRTWMLALLVKNTGLYHTALSLSAYVFSTALSAQHSGHDHCKDGSWECLLKQSELSIKTIQQDVEQFNRDGIQDRLVEGGQLMGSVMQMLTFQMGCGCGEYWQPHMDAAIALFEQIFQHYGTVNGVPDMKVVLEKMGEMSWRNGHPKNHTVWAPDQAAFLFFGSLVLAYDIIASTSLEQPPRLQAYHQRLLIGSGCPDDEPLVKLENFVGCQNWVLILIAELDRFKQSKQ